MLNINFEAVAVGAEAGASSRFDSGFTEMMRLRNTGLKYIF
jgi:hypothetical protein